MAASDIEMAGTKRPSDEIENVYRKKFKTSELPISSAQRAAIDSLLYSFKKKGGFDAIRKKIWAEFNGSEAKKSFTSALIEMAESEIERDPSLLSRERGKAATLIEGAVDRSDLYKSVESAVDALSANFLGEILDVLRSIRRQEVGEETARAEEQKGSTTDEEYARLVQAKREEREEARLKELETKRKLKEERAKADAEERRKQREIRRQQKEAERKEREEREEKRRAEREARREEERKLDEQRDKEREECRRRRDEEEREYRERRREEREKERDRERARDRDDDRRRDSDRDTNRNRDGRSERTPGKETSRTPKAPTPSPAPVDEKALEDQALELLLKEGKELAAKSKQRPEFDFEKAEALEEEQQAQAHPPSVKASMPSRPKNERDKANREVAENRYDKYRARPRDRSQSGSVTRRSSHYDDERYRGKDTDKRDREYRTPRDRHDRDDRSTTRRRTRSPVQERSRDQTETGIGTEKTDENETGRGD
ncbi:predicted protein [Uncinocarpus reesii 1704]|uniref:BOD1/SHG1 domain-containing protein n=1 Tax=Uncinocarpus reesii (strain UAMH 1704) TaxID=336963 RepID=C4JQM2_UNCRE|nr:uncharacterized protein UREG_03367 [Uncinocarpus reesii 1704]EEP78521.1 predicted protein [Uncinocarpus reesii 1704]